MPRFTSAGQRFTLLPLLLAVVMMLCHTSPAQAQANSAKEHRFKTDLFVLASQHPLVGTQFPQELEQNAAVIDAVAPMWFGPDDQGNIPPLENCDGPYSDYVARAKALNIKVLPILRNFKPQGLLSNPAAVAKCVEETVRLVNEHGFDGIVVDFEHLEASSRQPLVDLVSGIYARLHPQGKLVIVATASRAWKKEYDFPQLAQNCDYIYVMTYDYVGAWSQRVGPTAPWNWTGQTRDIERDLQIILGQNVPASKLLMGLALYGADFTLTDDASRHAGVDVQPTNVLKALAEKHQAALQFDVAMLSSYFDYTAGDGRRHRVWFDDAASFSGKLEKTRKLGMSGVGIWSLRYPDRTVGEDLWQTLKSAQ
jgi:spore germination protein YaaH